MKSAAQVEEKIIKLNDERIYLQKLIKEYETNLELFYKRIEKINEEIEELIK